MPKHPISSCTSSLLSPGRRVADFGTDSGSFAEAKRRGKILGANGKNLAAQNRNAADAFVATRRVKLDADLMGRSYSQIARRLNDSGILTVTGRKFHPQTVKNYIVQ